MSATSEEIKEAQRQRARQRDCLHGDIRNEGGPGGRCAWCGRVFTPDEMYVRDLEDRLRKAEAKVEILEEKLEEAYRRAPYVRPMTRKELQAQEEWEEFLKQVYTEDDLPRIPGTSWGN